MRLRLGTRGSALALTQSGQVADALRGLGHDVELVTIRSEGDVTAGSLTDAGGLGLFAATLRRALLGGEVDLAVHSLKDLPTAGVPGLVVAAIPPREAPDDALCARDGLTLAALPAGARVGTGSPRRAAQLRARRPDLTVVEIRGNVGTRLARVSSPGGAGDLDAVVLARAGLARLGLLDAVTDTLDLVPAAGQGALAVECRADDAATRAALEALDDAATRLAVTAERAVLAELRAGCAAPLGAHARLVDREWELIAVVTSPDGTAEVTARRTAWADPARDADPDPGAGPGSPPTSHPDAEALGRAVAADLLAQGAADVAPLGATRPSRLAEFHHERALWAPGTRPELVGRRVLLPRADGPLAEGVRAAGATVDAVPLTRTVPLPFDPPARAEWVVFTSANAVAAVLAAGLDPATIAARLAAVGRATASAVEAAGGHVDLVPDGPSDADALLAALPEGPHSALLPGSALASPRLADGLRARGWDVTVLPTYTTETLVRLPDALSAGWDAYDAVVLTAGSAARAALDLLGPPPPGLKVVALGVPTAAAAAALGVRVDGVAATQDPPGVVDALAACLKEEK